MEKSKSRSGCCGCVFGIIAVIVVIALVAGFFISKYVTVEQVNLADTPGILHRFNEDYDKDATLRSVGMENWKVYDVIVWIIKSGDYDPNS